MTRERSVRLGECLCGAAALSGEVIISDDPSCDARYAGPPAARPHGQVFIPLSSHEQVLGVLFIQLAPGQAVPPPERESLFRLMGRQIGISIENAQLYQRTDAQLRQKVGELTRALSTLERERTRAETSERTKEEFVSMVSHDLRSPLTVILADSGEYASACKDPACVQARASVRHSARRMAVMLNELVDSARLESGTLELQPGDRRPERAAARPGGPRLRRRRAQPPPVRRASAAAGALGRPLLAGARARQRHRQRPQVRPGREPGPHHARHRRRGRRWRT